MLVVNQFRSSYAIDTAPSWPELGEEVLSFLAYDKLNMHTKQFQDIRFQVKDEKSWIGRFEFGQREPLEHAIFTVPNPLQALVISSGAGYWVDVEQKRATRLECLPITQAVVAIEYSLIIVATWKDLYAYSSLQMSWSLQNVAEDRVKITRIDDNILTAVGWYMGQMVPIHVDIATGKAL